MKHNSKSTLTTKYPAGEQIVMDRNVFLRYNKKHHTLEGKFMKMNLLKKAGIAALTGAVLVSAVPAYADTFDNFETPEYGWSADGRYWYENGVQQGLEGRGKEIYDPETDAWYWLDSVQRGAKAVSKDVYQESWAGAFAENEDGTGKWTRYDENGHMVKGWDTNNKGTYYFDPETGAMAKGTVVIDGVEYIFDSYSGILCDKVFLNVDGNEYWYENGVRQGTEGRGKEIYDPATDGWYWLDAVDGGKRAVSKDVFQESDGGKWVRYDENGKMVKGWNATVDKGKLTFVIDPNTGASHWDYESYEGDGDIYYFDPVTGAMAKGTVVIDGETYVFDETTGVLDVSCIKKTGRLSCIEADSKAKAEKYHGSNQMDEATYNALVAACEAGQGYHDYININGYSAMYWDEYVTDGIGMYTPNGRHGYPYEYEYGTITDNLDHWRFFYTVVRYDAETDKTTTTVFVGA